MSRHRSVMCETQLSDAATSLAVAVPMELAR
jgi:hypothetical protein